MSDSVTIATNPNLPTAQNYLQLRQLALAYLQSTGDAAWTDYNLHDPGITFMELFAYCITDLSYRQDMPVATLLAVDINGDINGDSQVLYTPAEILTISPLTINDYRILLINVTGIANAWLSVCTTVSGQCGYPLYVDCTTQSLSYNETPNNLIYGGLYDVTLQLDTDSSLGNLNSGSVVYHFVLPLAAGSSLPYQPCLDDPAVNYDGYIEMRFPSAGLISTNPLYAALLVLMEPGTTVIPPPGGITGFEISTDPIQYGPVIITNSPVGDPSQATSITDSQLRNSLNSALYASFLVHYTDPNGVSGTLEMDNIPFKVYFYDSDGNMIVQVSDLVTMIEETTAGGIFATYLAKLQAVETAVEDVRFELNEHRNYCEDFCSISLIQTEDFAICCDIDATTDADLDALQEAIYAGIINYLNPPLSFYSWEDLVSQGYTIDQIFNGPRSSCGFIKTSDLESSGIRTWIYTADLIKIIYGISGVVGVTRFSLVRINAAGNTAQVDPWQLQVTPGMLPDFYIYSSNIRFYKNSLPFNVDFSEVLDSLSIIATAGQNPKMSTVQLDVPLPTGKLLPLTDYYPLMYSLPPVYNVSPAGPMPPFTAQRYSQTNQLQAYLLLFEQIYADWLAQIGNLRLFFNTEDPTLPTYVSRFIANTDLSGVDNLYASCYTPGNLQFNCESQEEFNDRKNRIYNHLMARLGENNDDYTMISNTLNNSLLQDPAIILAEKARLLRKYPEDSYRKARALNYKYHNWLTSTVIHEGLIDKLCDLLGLDSMNDFFHWQSVTSPLGNYQLVGNSFSTTISISYSIYITITPEMNPPSVLTEGYYDQAIRGIDAMLDPTTGSGPQWAQDGQGNYYYFILGGYRAPGNTFIETCRITTPFNTMADAWAVYSTLTNQLNHLWISNMILPVEHILLRPWTIGEPTLNTCIPANCMFCGDEDPYSFRMTIIMCGDVGFPGYDLDFRAYAETLIRTEIPAHILIKICWLSEADCIALSCYYRNYVLLISCLNQPEPVPGSGSGSGSGRNQWGSAPADWGDGDIAWSLDQDAADVTTSWSCSGSGMASGGGSGSGSGSVDWGYWVGGYNGCGGFAPVGSGSGSGSGGRWCTNEEVIAARGQLVCKLNSIRSLYPPAVLNNCISSNPTSLVYLGKTVL